MAKLFIGIALVVILATAALGFLTKGRIDGLQTSLRDTKAKQAQAEGQAKTAKAEEEKAKKELQVANDKATEAAKVAEAKAAEADAAKKDLAEKVALVEAGMAKITALQGQVDELIKQKGDPEAIKRLTDQITELTAKNDAAQKDLAEVKAVVESQQVKVKVAEEKASELAKMEERREKQIGLKGLQARILAVNSGWNFVVLSVGDKQGVAVNSPLLVVRGNQPIAKLRITSVEPSTSIADILPGSVSRGTSVQPGDTVIFQGRTPAVTPESKPATEGSGGGAAPQLPITAPPQ